MADSVELTIKDFLSPELQRLARRCSDFSPVMAKVESVILKPLKRSAWDSSGLLSRSGELLGAIDTWHGKTSAGITIRSKRGRDLVIPKAVTHTKGAKKGKFGRKRKSEFKVKGYTARGGRMVAAYRKKTGVFPWGDIPARKFFPEQEELQRETPVVEKMIKEFLQNA